MFGPQKGATPEMVAQTDAGLHHLAEIIRRDIGIDVEHLPARERPADWVRDWSPSPARGSIAASRSSPRPSTSSAAWPARTWCSRARAGWDASSSFGKTAVGVARTGPRGRRPGRLHSGAAAPDAPADLFQAVLPLVTADITPALAMRKAAQLLQSRAAEAVRRMAVELRRR